MSLESVGAKLEIAMRNVDVQCVQFCSVSIPRDHTLLRWCSRIADVAGAPHLYTLAHSKSLSSLVLQCTPLDTTTKPQWSSCDLSPYLSSPFDTAVGLDADPAALDPVLVALRGGALLSIDVENGAVELVGEVVDDHGVESQSGVLALAKSPDGALVAIVSPVKVIIMTSSWDLVAELDIQSEAGQLAAEAKISWRGDGAAFVVVMRDETGAAYGRVIDRDAQHVVYLQVGDVGLGLTGGQGAFGNAVAWQPRVGGFIFTAGPGHAVSVFERNGLRHLRSDFKLDVDDGDGDVSEGACSPSALEWSRNSSMLATFSPRKRPCGLLPADVVNLYTRSNYKWYRKLCIPVAAGVADIRWDNEEQFVLHVLSSDGSLSSYRLRSSHAGSVSSTGLCGVINGAQLAVTSFATALVPPPMSHFTFRASAPISAVCFFSKECPASEDAAKPKSGLTVVGSLLASGAFETIVARGPGVDANISRQSWMIARPSATISQFFVRHPVLLSPELVAVVEFSSASSSSQKESIALHHILPETNKSCKIAVAGLGSSVLALSTPIGTEADTNTGLFFVAALSSGELAQLRVTGVTMPGAEKQCKLEVVQRIPCEAARAAVSLRAFTCRKHESSPDADRVAVTVCDESGRLEVADLRSAQTVVLSSECTSFAITNSFLLFSTRSHVLKCMPIGCSESSVGPAVDTPEASVLGLLSSEVESPKATTGTTTAGAVRPVDRGSVIVCPLPKDVRVILQAPRGSIETVAPRPLLLAEVRRLAKSKQYGKAFKLSRQQRIDMNIMVDADPGEFLASVPLLLEEVRVPSHLSVFLTYLRGDDAQVNSVCDAVVAAIDELKKESSRFTTTVLTAMVRRRPPNLPLALKRVRESYSRSEEEGANALDFLLVLVKSEELLYNEALAMYDLETALMVAKASQLDPVEYSEELRLLSGMDEYRRRYTIDMKLEKYEAALKNLFACGSGEREACLALAVEHELYLCAIRLFKDDQAALSLLRRQYGGYLALKGRYADSAVVFTANGDFERAACSYRDGGLWRLALSTFGQFEMQRKCASETLNVGGDTVRAGNEGAPWQPTKEWSDFAESVADGLAEQGSFVDSAAVRWSMLRDLEGAVESLVGAQEWRVAFETVASAQNCFEMRDGVYLSSKAARAYSLVVGSLEEAVADHVSDLKDSSAKLRERNQRLVAVRETKARMSSALGIPGGGGGGDQDSEVFSVSTGRSEGTDVTFASSTSTLQSRTSIYSSIGRGRGGMKGVEARERKAAKTARKRVRTGHPREEEALVATLKRLVPNKFLRLRLGSAVEALCHTGNFSSAAELCEALDSVLGECRALPSDLQNDETVFEALADDSWRIDLVDDLKV